MNLQSNFTRSLLCAAALGAIFGSFGVLSASPEEPVEPEHAAEPRHASAEAPLPAGAPVPPNETDAAATNKVTRAYLEWRQAHDAQGGDRKVSLAVRWAKGLSARHTTAQGVVRLDWIGGEVVVSLNGLGPHGPVDVWLVDNREAPGSSVRPEGGDEFVFVGTVYPDEAGDGELAETVPALRTLELDLVMVTEKGVSPTQSGILFGALPLFQRLYTRERLSGL